MKPQRLPTAQRPNLLRDTLKRLEHQHLPALSEADDDDISLTSPPRTAQPRSSRKVDYAQSPTYKCSAKELIGRYESMSPKLASLVTPSQAQARPPSRQHASSGLTHQTCIAIPDSPKVSVWEDDEDEIDDPRKGHFPIRKSFKTFVSALNKKASKWKEESNTKDAIDSKPYSLRRVQSTQESLSTTSHPMQPHTKPVSAPGQLHTTPKGPCGSLPVNSMLRCGDIIHLSRPFTSTASHTLLPVWTHACMGLYSFQLILSIASSGGQSETQSILLAGCVDVRPLGSREIGEHERAMMPDRVEPDRIDEPRVFELVYQGGQKEIFGAATVKERAKWVSAIWYVVLFSRRRATPQRCLL
jgi:hypothetical protein